MTAIIVGSIVAFLLLCFIVIVWHHPLYVFFFEHTEWKTYYTLTKNLQNFPEIKDFRDSMIPTYDFCFNDWHVILWINTKSVSVFKGNKVIASGFHRKKAEKLYEQICKYYNLEY